MNYFHAQLGKAVRGSPFKCEKARRIDLRVLPLFGAQLGQKPVALARETPAKKYVVPSPGTGPAQEAGNCGDMKCPLCQGCLVLDDGLYRCRGRCGAIWLEDRTGHMVDVTSLPYGLCGCCNPPKMLEQSTGGAICPGSAKEYLLLPEGIALRSVAAPHGLCHCCLPPAPLMAKAAAFGIEEGDGLVCRLKPYNRYRMINGETAWLGAGGVANQEEILQAIDKALAENSAKLTQYGIFDID